MALDDRAHVAGSQALGRQIDRENCVFEEFEVSHGSLRVHCNQLRPVCAKVDLPDASKHHRVATWSSQRGNDFVSPAPNGFPLLDYFAREVLAAKIISQYLPAI
jgi:hypothetical protein